MNGVERRSVSPERLPEVCGALTRDDHARLVVMTGTDERDRGGGFGLYYTFVRPSGALATVEAQVDPVHPVFPSVTSSLQPRTSVATAGRPAATPSINDLGTPSR